MFQTKDPNKTPEKNKKASEMEIIYWIKSLKKQSWRYSPYSREEWKNSVRMSAKT